MKDVRDLYVKKPFKNLNEAYCILCWSLHSHCNDENKKKKKEEELHVCLIIILLAIVQRFSANFSWLRRSIAKQQYCNLHLIFV